MGEERFDWIFASHVVEHTPDLISFINECASILKPGGFLFLAVPDKRYTFDLFRPQSSIGAIVDAHDAKSKMPSRGARAEYSFYCGLKNQKSLCAEFFLPYIPAKDISQFKSQEEKCIIYQDVHVWSFTPSHFRLIIETLFQANLISLREKYFQDSVGIEFFITLATSGKGPAGDIAALMTRAIKESHSYWPLAGRGTRWPINMADMLDNRFFKGRLRAYYRYFKSKK